MNGELVVIEKEDAYVVAWVDDPEDWVAIFSRKAGFPARQWADRMVYLYNQRSKHIPTLAEEPSF
jgi:hypothetical protein